MIENGLPEATRPHHLEIEIRERDFDKFVDLAHPRERAASLSAATDGHLERSVRHRELRRPSGFEDELRAALVGDAGTWGAIVLLREPGTTDSSADDTRRLA